MTALHARVRLPPLTLMLLALLCGGCERGLRNMYNQPKYPPYAASPLFPDGMASRPVVPGTVPYSGGGFAGTSSGHLGLLPIPLHYGPAYPLVAAQGPLGAEALRQERGELPERIPYPITPALLARGRERFDIYCTPCHGLLGDGGGIVPRRGFPAPPSYHTERLRRAPDSHFFVVMSDGYGVMFPYADRVAPADRWAIVAYIRALQLSQNARRTDVPTGTDAALGH